MVYDKIVLNESTKNDVIQLLGEPLSKDFNAKNEIEIWHYAHVKKNITGAGLLGHVVGVGAQWKTNTEVADFYMQRRLRNMQGRRRMGEVSPLAKNPKRLHPI